MGGHGIKGGIIETEKKPLKKNGLKVTINGRKNMNKLSKTIVLLFFIVAILHLVYEIKRVEIASRTIEHQLLNLVQKNHKAILILNNRTW